MSFYLSVRNKTVWLVASVLLPLFSLAQEGYYLEPDPYMDDDLDAVHFDMTFDLEAGFESLGEFSSTNDTDSDGMLDDYEIFFGLNYTNPADADENGDVDLLLNGSEEDIQTDPHVSDTDRDGFLDDIDVNPLSRVYIHWGDPRNTLQNDYYYVGPEWWTVAYRIGGEWLTNSLYGWEGTPLAVRANMVWTPDGTNCVMDPDGTNGPPYTLIVSNGFFIDQKEVYKWLWDSVRDWATNGNGYQGLPSCDSVRVGHPIQNIDWYTAVKWCNARSEKNGFPPAYYTSSEKTNVYRSGRIDISDDCVNWYGGFRLPRTNEWEYAGRGEYHDTRFPWHNDNITHPRANYYSTNIFLYDTSSTKGYHPSFKTNGIPYTSPVGYFNTNGFNEGLYDMAGNVFEWTWDWHNTGQTKRSLRGGSWNNLADLCRVGSQIGRDPTNKYDWLGFRSILAKSETEKLVIGLDRTILTNDVVIKLEFTNDVGSVLYIGLAASNHTWVVSNLYGNVLGGSQVTTNIPLTNYPAASEIVLWTDEGPITVYKTYLYIDQDHDGLDSDQEVQYGISDNSNDSDNDGKSDYSEVFDNYNPADPLDPAMVQGNISYSGIQTGSILVIAVTSTNSWSTNCSTVINALGPYTLPNVHKGYYWIKCFRDSNGNKGKDLTEAGGITSDSIYVSGIMTNLNLRLMDPGDSDGDGISDNDELFYYGTDPYNDDTNKPIVAITFPQVNNYRMVMP